MHRDLTPHDKVISTAELHANGMSHHAIATRCRPSGPWQRLLPGVVLMAAGQPTRRQRLRAAVVYAGQDAVVTGVDAMRAHGVDVPVPPEVLVLVPSQRRLSSRAYLTVERTTRPPVRVVQATLPYAPLARATLDAARRAADQAQLRMLLGAAVGPCTVAELRAELDAGNQRGSAAVRALLTPTFTGESEVVPATVAAARRLLRNTPLPPPCWHAPVHDQNGMLLGVADMWWPDVSFAWDLGGANTRHHIPRMWAAGGVTLFRSDPDRLRAEPVAVAEELVTAFRSAATRQERRAS